MKLRYFEEKIVAITGRLGGMPYKNDDLEDIVS